MLEQEEIFTPCKEKKVKSFIHTLPQAIEIFQVLQHDKKSIYPFQMISNKHKQMNNQQQPYWKQQNDKVQGEKFKPFLPTVKAHFDKKFLIYDKFNNNKDEELFNQNIYSIDKLKNFKNTDYVTQIQFSKCYQKYEHPHMLEFNSRFESGNLSMVSFLDGVYYLLLHNDVNTSGYTSWFYFCARNKIAAKYKFAILNYGKAGIMHNQGVRICIHEGKTGWKRGGKNISCETNWSLFKKGDFLNFNTLYFQYQYQEDESQVYFAYNVPYTYNDLCCFLDKIQQESLPFFNRKLAGISLAGNRLEAISITNFSLLNEGIDLPVIVLMARSHPGQTVSSWIMHQLIKFLISDDPEAKALRNNFLFKLFPMINPDGVIHGNYRCSLSGRDLNRRWNQTNKQLFPEVYFIRNQIIDISKRKAIKLIIDLHGHTKKKKVFAYGCNNYNQPHRCRLFPYILSKQTTHFQFKFCNYYLSKYKEGTARISLYNQLKIPYVYTIQMSQFGTFEGHLSLNVFKETAISIGRSFLILFRIKIIDKEGRNPSEKYEKIEQQLSNDMNLIKIGNEKDSGSQSEPSVDNIKYDRLYQLNKRREMKINSFKITHERFKSNEVSQSIQKIARNIEKRPSTSEPQAKRYHQQRKKSQKVILQQKIFSLKNSKIIKPRKEQKTEGTNKSLPIQKRISQGQGVVNFINMSLSIFDDNPKQRSYKFDNFVQETQKQAHLALFNKLRMTPRQYFHIRRPK